MQPPTRGRIAAVRDARDLARRHTVELTQRQREAVLDGQLCEYRGHALAQVGVGVGGGTLQGQARKVLDRQRATLAAAEVVDGEIAGDAIEPVQEVAGPIEAFECGVDADERLLRYVAGFFGIQDDVVRDPVYLLLVALDELSKCVVTPAEDRFDEGGVFEAPLRSPLALRLGALLGAGLAARELPAF